MSAELVACGPGVAAAVVDSLKVGSEDSRWQTHFREWAAIWGSLKKDIESGFDMPSYAEASLLELPHISEAKEPGIYRLDAADIPLKEVFAPGVYFREVLMPAGSLIIGHQHRTEHLNIISEGAALVSMDGVVQRIEAPCVFVSKPGVRKVLLIERTCRWATVHPTDTTDPSTLRAELIIESDAFQRHKLEADAQKLLSMAEQHTDP